MAPFITKVVTAVFFVLLASGCSDYRPAENYCEAENRQIPDVEMKARLLTSLYKEAVYYQERVKNLTPEMQQYLTDRNLSFFSSEIEIHAALAAFIESNPLCCQLAVKEIWSKDNYPFNDSQNDRIGYFANFYILEPPYFKLPDTGITGFGKPSLWPHVYKTVRAFNCGMAVNVN